MPTASSLAWKTSLRKRSQDAVALQQIKGVALYLWLIVVISVRQSTVATISGLHQALVMVSSSIKGWQPDCKIQRSGRNDSERLMYEQNTAIISLWLSASSSACHGPLKIITVITPLPTKPARQKCQRTEAGERGNYWSSTDASGGRCCCARCKIHRS